MTLIRAVDPQAIHALDVNPRYVYRLADGQVVCVRHDGGSWSVKVRQLGDRWVAFAVPRAGTVDKPFDLASGTDRDAVWKLACLWATSAQTLGMRYDRAVFAGFGDATEEMPHDGVPEALFAAVTR
ncbi:hypothetical protein [Dactylosporangium salmoneum]|uniref:Uncharacterized protein n=1 Tax=Dactylosporangium salmoneum TaxID=53361 RepID=A0ABN3G9C7_9ACTN